MPNTFFFLQKTPIHIWIFLVKCKYKYFYIKHKFPLKTELQIESGGLVQGVTKSITTFSTFMTLKTKFCQLSWQKMELYDLIKEIKGFSNNGKNKFTML